LAGELGPACDRATIDELRAEDDTLLPELVTIFQTELTKGLGQLVRALEQQNCAAIAHIAHTFKGSAGTFGATRMHQMAASIEQVARAGQAEQANAMLDRFRAECERVRTYLAAELRRHREASR
jgi:histidine phosphotransfer protein HptB